MPSVTLHLRLAEQVLEEWTASPGEAPFDPRDSVCATAFLVGAMGPDMGYFPGGFRPLSDLAHTLSPGALARSLVAHSLSPRERAFSWGWATHLLADVLVHPLVGCAVGDLTHGSPSVFVGADEDPVNHVRVEAGLDALYALRHPELRARPLHPVFDAGAVAFLRSAYVDTYGVAPELFRFLEAHRLAPRRMRQGLVLAGVAAAAMPDRPGEIPGPRGPLRRLRSFVGGRSVSLAFLLPAPPPLWLINAVRDVEETFVELFLEEFRAGGALLPDANLDTGRHYLDDPGHGGLRRSLDYVVAMGGSVPFALRDAEGAA